jgi:TolA-binding protein
MARKVAACFFLAGIFALLYFPQSAACQLSSASFDARSAVFQPPFEEKVEDALGHFRTSDLESLSADELARLQSVERDDYALGEQLLSLDLFRSLAAYYRDLPFAAESRIDNMLSNAPNASPTAANTALLGALEFYAHTPLSHSEVEAGVARLNAIASINAASAAVQPEIHFWKAEGYRALDKQAQAETEYRDAIGTSSDPRLLALSCFRIGELFEREERFAEADSNFAAASRIRESPLVLLSLLRLGAVRRAEKHFEAVLITMDEADSLYHATEHVVRTSARDFEYTSPLIERLMLESVEHDRILGTAPENTSHATLPQLLSPFYLSEIELLRGSALSGLGQYEKATEVLARGNEIIDTTRDSVNGMSSTEQARFVSDAFKFERGWSLFQQQKYPDASAAFLELAVTDTAHQHYAVLRASSLPLRAQGMYFDPYLNDSLTPGVEASSQIPAIDRSIHGKTEIDTSSFIYNDFPERARYYAGVALARAGMLDEAADALQKLTLDPSMLYSDKAMYQLALIRFAQHRYEAQKLLEMVSDEHSVRGAYASFLLGELAYRRNDYERADAYFLNSFANLPPNDTALRATAHLERGLSLIPLGNWHEASDELATYLGESHEHILDRTDEALFWMGKAYFRAGEYDSASVTFSRLLMEFPETARREDAQYAYAWSLFETNDFAHAEQEFERVIVMDSISRYAYDALEHAGDSYYAMGDTKRANKLYNQATDRPGFNQLRITRATLMLGVTRMKIDSERSAMNAFEYITRKFPESDIADLADFDYALAAYSINLTGPAEAMVQKIVNHYHASAIAPRALYVAGEERVRHGDEHGSLHYYEQVLNDYPRSNEAGPALFALQDALADLKQIPEALAVADTFVAHNPKNPISPMVLLREGEFEMKLHEAGNALSTFRLFLSQYPTNVARPRAELLLAESELATKDTNAAISHLDTVIARYDSMDVAAAAYLDRARVERSQKKLDTAAIDFERAYQEQYYSFDAAPEAMFEYGEMLSEERKVDSAVHLLLDLSKRYPIQASIAARGAIRAGELLTSERRDDSARAVFAAVIAARPKDALGGAAMTQTGESYLTQSNWSKAASAFGEAIHEYPLAPESEHLSLFGLARADIHLAKKADAIRNLHTLLSMDGLPEPERASAKSLLDTLLPPAKKKLKKGRKQ